MRARTEGRALSCTACSWMPTTLACHAATISRLRCKDVTLALITEVNSGPGWLASPTRRPLNPPSPPPPPEQRGGGWTVELLDTSTGGGSTDGLQASPQPPPFMLRIQAKLRAQSR
eukprot:1770231-Alexandrium_andersonii.AAC.1